MPSMLRMLSIVLSVHFATSAIVSHEITSLPGWDANTTGPLPKMYSGYLPVGNTSGTPGFIHYWFIPSQRDPASDPVVYWTNGGPGGSGINAGLLTEMGLVHLNENSFTKDGIKAFRNPFAWSAQANMLYVSQPKGVGFSYCAIPTDKCVNNDVVAAQDAYDFFIAFFEAYSEYRSNEFYLTAESYGGIYLPMFMDELDRRGGTNLRGAAIGDGCWGTQVGTCNFNTGKSKQISLEFFSGHGMIDQVLEKQIRSECGGFSDNDVQKKGCADLLQKYSDKIGKFDIYNIYDTCGSDQAGDEGGGLTVSEIGQRMSQRSIAVEDETSALPHPQLATRTHAGEASLGAALNDYACGTGRAVSAWLKQPAVAQALHVKSNTSGMTYNWGPAKASGDLRPLYKRLAQKYRLLIYSGDVDACVPYWGTEEWTRELGFDVKKDWRAWHAEHLTRAGLQRAGYTIEYDTKTAEGEFRFMTIQGAGHLVPTYKPHFALTMINNFLDKTDPK